MLADLVIRFFKIADLFYHITSNLSRENTPDY